MKSIKLLALFLLAAGLTFGCLGEDEDNTYQGPTLVEFAPVPPSANAYASTVTFGASETAAREVPIKIQMVGPHQSTDTQVTFEVLSTSTAVAGTHYTLSGTSATIPAGSSIGTIVVNALGAGLSSGQTRTVVLRLTGGTFQPNENYKTYTLTLRKS